MQIHELNNFAGALGSGAYLPIDDGTDTGKISSQGLLAATEARIDNIIAGPAPSAEEIVDARLGADGVTYPSLGDAIRDQFTDVKSALSSAKGRLYDLDGLDIPEMELGGIAFASSTIAFQTSTKAVRTPQNNGIPVKIGDRIKLLDTVNLKMKCAVKRDSDSKYDYSSYGTADYKVQHDGTLFIVVAYSDDRNVSIVNALATSVNILKAKANVTLETKLFDMFENGTFAESLLARGDLDSVALITNESSKIYRVSTPIKLVFDTTIRLTTSPDFAMCLYELISGTWTRRGSSTAWLGAVDIQAGTVFTFSLRRATEDTSETADVSEFASALHISNIFDTPNYDDNYRSVLETNHFDTSLFGKGQTDSALDSCIAPTLRRYRASTLRPITLDYDIDLVCASGYVFFLMEYLNGVWTRRGGPSAWLSNASVSKGTRFAISIRTEPEVTTGEADIPTFVSKLEVKTNLTNLIGSDALPAVDENAIEEYMAHFYDSQEVEAYAFFTDPHLMGTDGTFDINAFYLHMNTLAETVRRTSANYVVCGGDWLSSGDTKAQASYKLGFVDGKLRSMFPEKYYPIVGNHDFNYLGVDGEGNRLTEANWVSNVAMRNFWFHEYDNCYYKFKVATAQNYMLNTRTDHDGTNAYDKTMLDWLAQNLIEDDAPHSTIMFHIYYLSSVGSTIPKRVVAIGKIIEAFNNHSVCTLTDATEGYSKTYDFTGTTGHIDYVIVGHTHADFSDTLGGVPVIGCDNFTEGGTATFDLIFADYTNGKVYTTRIGSGSSREFSI